MLRMLRLFFFTFFETLRARRSRGPARPSWTLTFEWIIRCLRRDWEETSAWPLPRVRAQVDGRPYPTNMVKKTRTKDVELDGRPARWFVAPGGRESPVILFFHGGSYIYGSARGSHADLLARLTLASGIAVVGIDYRLAPEHPFPAQLEDAVASFDALVREGTTPENIVVAGDSAGGNLAIELQLALRDRGSKQAAGAILLSPWSDLEMPGRSFQENDPYDFGTRDVLAKHARAYAGDVPLRDPRLSPTHARLEGLAPVFVSVGEVEIPCDDILLLATRLADAGVDVTRHIAQDLPHNPALFAAYHPNGQAALDEAGRFAKRLLAQPS